MRTPVVTNNGHLADLAPRDDRRDAGASDEEIGQAGRPLVGVLIVSIAFWIGILWATRALIAAL